MPRTAAATILQSYYAAFNRRDYPAMLALLHPDVVHDINQGGSEAGREAFALFLQRMDKAYREELRDITIMTSDDGLAASASFTVHGLYLQADPGMPPAHGQTYVLPAAAFFQIKDGLITRVTVYYNLQDWLRQVATPV